MENLNEFEDAAAMKKEWQRRHEASGDDRDRQNEWHDHVETEKYLGMEQHGVSYTPDGHETMNSDYFETKHPESDRWKMSGDNSRNADAFSQDDYILKDNIDLDEDQNISISADDIDK